jgi:hypothetical protein
LKTLSNLRTALRLPALVVIGLLAYLAVTAFQNLDDTGFVWLGAAGVILAVVMPTLIQGDPLQPIIPPSERFRLDDDASARPSANILGIAGRVRRWAGLALLLVGVIFMLDAGRVFAAQLQVTVTPNSEPWDRFFLGLPLWIIGGFLLTRGAPTKHWERVSLVLLVILGIAVFLRFYLLDSLPFGIWYDEGSQGIRARDMLIRPEFRPVFDGHSFMQQALYAIALDLFGRTNIAAIRAVTALFGVAGVFMAFVVGRELRGPLFGLLLASVLATMRWSFTFSRMAMNSIEVVFFTLLALYFAIRLIRHRHLRDAVLLGLTVGFGLWFYRAFQFAAVAIAALIVISWPLRPFKRTLLVGLTALANVAAVFLPLAIFALTRPEFFDRINQTAIFTDTVPVNEALAYNIPAHLRMFHIAGDRNGRHNLPGAPELDLVTGVLFGLGLVVAVRDRARRANLFFAALLIAGLIPAILTVTFEAPQSLRAIAVITPVVYFAGLGALALGQTAWCGLVEGGAAIQRFGGAGSTSSSFSGTGLQRLPKYLAPAAILALALVLAGLNYNVYFRQAHSTYSVWLEHSTYETLVGRFMAALDDYTQIYTSPFLFRHVSTLFLAQRQAERTQLMQMPDVLPVRQSPGQDVVLFFVRDERALYEYARRLYPNATFREVSPRDYGIEPPENELYLFYVVELSPEDVASVQGLSANGSGVFYAPQYGRYEFALPPGATLQLDSETLTGQTAVQLAQGNHAVQISPPDTPLELIQNGSWQLVPSWMLYHDPVRAYGVRAAFYNNGNWEGDPVRVETHPFIHQYIHILPMERPYSVRYTGQLYIPKEGEYMFGISARDYARMWLDGEPVLETLEPGQRNMQSIMLAEGWHDIEVRRQDLTASTSIYLEWFDADQNTFVPIPMENFRPSPE